MTAASTVYSPLSAHERDTIAQILQRALVDLVQLHLVAKQAHWNVVGPSFRNVHLQLDELVTEVRGYADDVAERAAALDVPIDGRTQTIAQATDVSDLGPGWRADHEVVAFVVGVLERVIGTLRSGINETDHSDQVTQDLLIQITSGLEKDHWMWRAQLAGR